MNEHIPTPPAAGWYPDPAGQPGQRYYDGAKWTAHFTPYPPAANQPSVVVNNHVGLPAPAIAVAVSGGVNHGLHLLLTLLTCGVWLPIWIIIAIFGGGSRSVAVSSGPGVAVSGGGPKVGLVVGAIFVGLFMLGVVVENPWLLAILIPSALAGGGLFYMSKQRQNRGAEEQKLAMRAEYENDLYAEGDPRGTHGRYLPSEEFR